MTALPETFRCVPLSCTLTRHGCADRHVRAKNNGRTPGARVNDRAIFAAACRDCAIGAAHARGERPDVTIASIVARVTETKNEEGVMPRAKVYEHEGEKLTTKQLASRAVEGVGQELIGIRLSKGWTVEEAITIPNGESRPNRKNGRPLIDAPSPKTQARREQRARASEMLEATVEATRGKRGPLPRLLEVARAKGVAERAIVEMGSADHAAEVLARLGYDVEDAGIVPAGRLILVRTPHAPQVRA